MEIIDEYTTLENKLLSNDFIVQLLKNPKVKIWIFYDNNSSFTDKTIENFNRNNNTTFNRNELLDALFVKTDLENETSYWIIMPDSKIILFKN